MNTLFILNDPPYGTERDYNALRLAQALLGAGSEPAKLSLFLMADAVAAARKGQKTAAGYYNLEHMLRRLIPAGARVMLCGTCMDARGIVADELIEGAVRSTMDELARAAIAADKVFVF